MNKKYVLVVLTSILCTLLVVGCTPQTDISNVNNTSDIYTAFTQAAQVFARLDLGLSQQPIVDLHNIQQDGDIRLAIVDVETQITNANAKNIALNWLERNKSYLEQWQIDNIQAWISQLDTDPTATIKWTYKLMSASVEEALAGNFTVWYWTSVNKVPIGYIEHWKPVVYTHTNGFNPYDIIYRQLFELVRYKT